jgi:hypothetical protein
MANQTGVITVNGIKIIECDVNPSIGLGLSAPIGSIASARDGSGLFYKNSFGDTSWSNNSFVKQIGASVNGLGSAIQVGSVGFSMPSFSGNIISWSLIGDVSGDVVFDVKVSGVSIVGAGNKPTIVAGLSNSANVSGWTSVSVVAGSYIEFVIESVSSFKNINLVLNVS